MSDDEYFELMQEIEEYKSAHKYVECISAMERYEKILNEPSARAVILTAKATCALQVGDVEVADHALSSIEGEALPESMNQYIGLVKASAAHMGGRLVETDEILSDLLSKELSSLGRDPEVLYEILARRGFVQADMGRFNEAMKSLESASLLSEFGEFRTNIKLFKAFCLQGLGRLDEAEECIKRLLGLEAAAARAEHYYRLGAINLQQGKLDDAQRAFENALVRPLSGRVQRDDIVAALKQVKIALDAIGHFETPFQRGKSYPS